MFFLAVSFSKFACMREQPTEWDYSAEKSYICIWTANEEFFFLFFIETVYVTVIKRRMYCLYASMVWEIRSVSESVSIFTWVCVLFFLKNRQCHGIRLKHFKCFVFNVMLLLCFFLLLLFFLLVILYFSSVSVWLALLWFRSVFETVRMLVIVSLVLFTLL